MRAFRGFHRAMRLLARHCPASRPVRVEFRPIGWWGDTDLDRAGFLIRLRGDLTEAEGLDALSHEYAHVLAWRRSRIDHGPAWAVAYSRVYRILVEDWRPRRRA